MSGPVRAHLVLGGEDLAAVPLAGEVTRHVNVCVVELRHAQSPELLPALLTGESFPFRNTRRLSSRIVTLPLSRDYFIVLLLESSRKLHTSGFR